MLSPKDIINYRAQKLEEIETDIDECLQKHFSWHRGGMRYSLEKSDLDITEIEMLVKKYSGGGWIVNHEKGCDDRPCGCCWNYLTFDLKNG